MKNFQVVLYYCYTPITNPHQHRDEHHEFCVKHGLLGRVIVAPEGLNGTVSGTHEAVSAYLSWLRKDSRFANIDFKIEDIDTHAFQKIFVRVKDEIVNSDLGVNPLERTGKYIEPADFKELINDPDVVLVDMRSNYEHRVGKFKGAITFDMENLRELPDHVAEIEHLKNKKVITYCTGGIKCEKASAYLLERGFTDVYQLHGGIIKYGIEEGGENFDGECYVFDGRITTPVNQVNPSVISTCCRCGTPTARMVNCADPICNEHLNMCDDCGWKHQGCCTQACEEAVDKRAYDGTGYYPKNSNHYTPEQGLRSARGSFAP